MPVLPVSENGWPVLPETSDKLYTWVIPTKQGEVKLRLRNGSAGFLLAYAFLLFSERIEATFGRVLDDWGYAYRAVRDDTVWSNHASGTAWDANALRHPLGAVGTLVKAAHWRLILRLRLQGLLRWGGDYHNRKDEMHTEVRPGARMWQCERLAKKRLNSKRGKRLIAANPTQRAVIFS